MDTKRAATDFYAVTNEVVSLGTHLLRVTVKQWNVVWVWHGEWMVSGHQALFLIAPLEEWEVDNPKTLEDIFIAKAKTIAHLQTERAQLHTRLIGIVTTKDKNQVSILGTCRLFHLLQLLRRVELVDRTL